MVLTNFPKHKVTIIWISCFMWEIDISKCPLYFIDLVQKYSYCHQKVIGRYDISGFAPIVMRMLVQLYM